MARPQIITEIYTPLYIYVVITLFFIQILLCVGENHKQNSSVSMLTNSRNTFFKTNVFMLLISLIGCPPTLGFFSKILILHVISSTQNISIIFLILILNVFLMVMYLQQLRLTQSLKKKSFSVTKSKPNTTQVFTIILFQVCNVFAVWIMPYTLDLVTYYIS